MCNWIAITTPRSAIIINRRNSLLVRFIDYEDIQNPLEEEMEPSKMSTMNLWHCSYFESYIPYEEDEQTETFLQNSCLSQKLLKQVDLWVEENKCQKQSFVNNETDSDDTDEEDKYVFRQRLFSTIDKENFDTENIEDLLEKINLHEFYENEINFKKMIDTNSRIDETESLLSFLGTHKGFMNDASSSNFTTQFDYVMEDYNMGFTPPPP